MRKLKNNKILVLAICIICISIIYIVVQNAIEKMEVDENHFEDIKESWLEEQGENIDNNDESFSEKNEGKIDSEEVELVLEENIQEDAEANLAEEKIIEKNKIYIYITGEVNVPGVVILEEGSRIVDAINAAGGTTKNANITRVNLVYVLEDGMKVNIPNDHDLKNNPDFEYITRNSGDGGRDDYSKEGKEEGGEKVDLNSKKYEVVNINKATQTELETLPGIGPSLALKIINYRKENGEFSSIEEVKNVSGIGDSKFEEIKKYITI